ncbi:MAG: Membrane protein related to metalloendopeptidase [Labilithrix sp.]|nr:Membrane protein related to metalloendopeptidase [Labilithrix sp.]
MLAGLVGLGLVLIASGPRAPTPSPSPSASVANAELPPGEKAAPAAALVAAPLAPTAADAGPPARPAPAWRVSSLASDPAVEILKTTLGKRSLAAALAQLGLPRAEVRRVTHAVDGIRRVEHAAGKDEIIVARDRSKGTVTAFEVVASPTDVWQARDEKGLGELAARKLEVFVEKKRAQAAFTITGDLKQAITAAGLREEAIDEIDDALDGHGDAAVIKPGVRLRVVGSEEYVEGAFAGFRVDAVEYLPRGAGAPLRVYFYERDPSSPGAHRRAPLPGYYDAKAQMPYRGTFRSPVPLARITSRFNPHRMHPVLHVVRPHNGIDFGASTGTPVFAASAGTVSTAGDGGPCGNMVQIEHAGGLSTAYCHLSKFAAGLRAGQHVEAHQLVGYVGATGRVTGPHLHFAVKRGGAFIDPSSLKMDGIRTLPPSDRETFAKRRQELDAALDAVALPNAGKVEGPADDDDKDEEPAGEE